MTGATSYAAVETRPDGLTIEVRITVPPAAAYDDQLELTELTQMGLVQVHKIIERNEDARLRDPWKVQPDPLLPEQPIGANEPPC